MPNLLQKLRELRRRKRPDDPDERPLAQKAIGIFAAILLLGGIFWWVPRYQVRHTPGVTNEKLFDDEDAARKTLAQILGGTIVLLGLYFSAKTFGLSRESQITDRFTKAIEQLGRMDGDRPNIEVRLGAIYALERIAIDSPRDHWTIMEVLTAYVRENAPHRIDPPYIPLEKPRTDVQAILTVIGRRRTGPKCERATQRLDLSRCHLVGALLYDGNFQGAFLLGVTLRSADLRGADFQEANLAGANLQNADLKEAKLVHTNLHKARLLSANLFKADLRHANIRKTNLQDANLRSANLQNADLHEAELKWVSGLNVDQIKGAANWETASYPAYFREKLGLVSESAQSPAPPASPEK